MLPFPLATPSHPPATSSAAGRSRWLLGCLLKDSVFRLAHSQCVTRQDFTLPIAVSQRGKLLFELCCLRLQLRSDLGLSPSIHRSHRRWKVTAIAQHRLS